jgi:hypothetical protein
MREGAARAASVRIRRQDAMQADDTLIAIHDIRIVGEGVDRPLDAVLRRFGQADDPPLRFTGSRSFSNRFDLPRDLPPGEYEVRADVEWAALLAEPALLDTSGRPRPPDRWPEAMVRQRTTMVAPVRVVGAGEQVVEFLPPEESRAGAEAFRRTVGRLGLKVTKDASGRLTVTLMRPPLREQVAEAYCFDVVAVFGETEITLGRIAGRQGGQSASGLSQTVDALPDGVSTADILLRPAPDEVDRMLTPTGDEAMPAIIGETIRFADVPVDRADS